MVMGCRASGLRNQSPSTTAATVLSNGVGDGSRKKLSDMFPQHAQRPAQVSLLTAASIICYLKKGRGGRKKKINYKIKREGSKQGEAVCS